jgi:hypothetical protein
MSRRGRPRSTVTDATCERDDLVGYIGVAVRIGFNGDIMAFTAAMKSNRSTTSRWLNGESAPTEASKQEICRVCELHEYNPQLAAKILND